MALGVGVAGMPDKTNLDIPAIHSTSSKFCLDGGNTGIRADQSEQWPRLSSSFGPLLSGSQQWACLRVISIVAFAVHG